MSAMKAKDLAEILLKDPDAEVYFGSITEAGGRGIPELKPLAVNDGHSLLRGRQIVFSNKELRDQYFPKWKDEIAEGL
jgi:hypothetical protein